MRPYATVYNYALQVCASLEDSSISTTINPNRTDCFPSLDAFGTYLTRLQAFLYVRNTMNLQ